MKKTNIYMIAAMVCLAFASCSEDTVDRYAAAVDNIYFDFADTTRSKLTYSFALYTPQIFEETIEIPVKLSGLRVAHDRRFRVAVDAAKTTAQVGLHYKALDESYLLPANTGTVTVPVTLYNNDPAMDNQTMVLALKLVESDDFRVDFQLKVTSRISFSNRLEEPWWWQYWQGTGDLGAYSRTRHFLFLTACGNVELNNQSTDGENTLRSMSYVKTYRSFIFDPFSFVARNPDYVLELQAGSLPAFPGAPTYHFYRTSNPEKYYVMVQMMMPGVTNCWINDDGGLIFVMN